MSSDLNTDEQRLRERLDSSVSDVRAPAHTEDRARTAGRRIRDRRRIGVGLSAAAVAAVVAVGLPNLIGGGDDPESTEGIPVATQPSSPASELPSRGPNEDPVSPDQPEPPRWTQKTAGEMAEVLRGLLPEGITVSHVDRPGGSRSYLLARLTTEDGPGKVNLVLSGPQPGSSVFTDGDATPADNAGASDDPSVGVEATAGGEARYNCDPTYIIDPDTCTVIKDDDGSVIGNIVDASTNGVRSLSVTMVTPDDGTVMVNVANTLADKWPDGATPSSPRVALTKAQLRAIASDPAWTD